MNDSVTNSAAAQFAATAASLLLLADKPVKCISSTQLTDPNIDSTLLVDHTYTDYASVSDAELLEFDRDWGTALTGDLSPEKRRLVGQLSAMPYKSVWTQPFPIRLHAVVSNPELSDIIEWMPHGRSFIVHDHKALEGVLTRYFNQTKFLSFVRQLNLWGFKRLMSEDRGRAYYHELFLRNRPYIARRIKRHELKDGRKPIHNPSAEPDFFIYPQLEEVQVTEKLASPAERRSKKSIMMGRAKSFETEKPKPCELDNDSTSLLKPAVSRPKDLSTVDAGMEKKQTQLEVPLPIPPPTPSAQATQPPHPAAAAAAALPCASSAAQVAASAPHTRLQGVAFPQALLKPAVSRPKNQSTADADMEVEQAQLKVPLPIGPLTAVAQATQPPHPTDAAHIAALATLASLQGAAFPQAYDHLYKMAQLQTGHHARRHLYQGLNSSVNMDNPTNMSLSDFHALIHPKTQHSYAPTNMTSTVSRGAQVDLYQMSADESLREARHLEELAAAARQRARNLALVAAMEAQSRYDMLVRKHAGGNGGGSSSEK